MPLILNLLDSGDVVMILSQLLLVAQAVVPVTQLLVSGGRMSPNEDNTENRLRCATDATSESK